jgi:hypothetical protein
MNYHYIEYMIKERRKEEVEECKRIRLLKRAGYTRTGCMERMLVAISKKISFRKDWVMFMGRSIVRLLSYRIFKTNQRGRNV